jgi:hypothetical protein
MPRIFRAIGDEFNYRFNRKEAASVNAFKMKLVLALTFFTLNFWVINAVARERYVEP